MFALRVFAWVLVGVIGFSGMSYWDASTTEGRQEAYLAQMDNNDANPAAVRTEYLVRNGIYVGAGVTWLLLGSIMFAPELSRTSKFVRSQVQ